MSSDKTNRANLPAAILVFALLMLWQMLAMGMDAAYILPSPVQVVQKLWDLRGPLFTAHLPATMQVVGIGLLISLRALVRLYHLEQGAGHGADDLFSCDDHSI